MDKIREQLIKILEQKHAYYYERYMSGRYTPDYNQDLKALSRLFSEAKYMVESIKTIETPEAFNDAVEAIINDTDWGWGSNWIDDAHYPAINEVKKIINKFLKNYEPK